MRLADEYRMIMANEKKHIYEKSHTYMMLDELVRAEKKHPVWPTNPIKQIAILAEEAGEALKEVLDWEEGKGNPQKVIDEVVQTGAMCFRFLKNFDPNWSKPLPFSQRSQATQDVLRDCIRGLEAHGENVRAHQLMNMIKQMEESDE